MILELLLGASTALILFLVSLSLLVSALGKGTSRLLGAVTLTFLLKLVLLFLALLLIRTLLGEISAPYIWSLVTNYLALLLLQVVIITRRIRLLRTFPEVDETAAATEEQV